MSGDRQFALFCTIGGGCLLFAVVADEVEAVRAYSEHVAEYTQTDHRPYIHMEPMRLEWAELCHYLPDVIDPAANLFRLPAEAAS
jgi:hypothetical protein